MHVHVSLQGVSVHDYVARVATYAPKNNFSDFQVAFFFFQIWQKIDRRVS